MEVTVTQTAPAPTSRLHTVAVVLSSLFIPLPLLAGATLEAVIDSVNPANVDVSQGLAYLRELLIFGFGFLAVMLVVILVLIVVLYRRARSFRAIALPVAVLVAQVVVGVALLVMRGAIAAAEAGYAAALV
jgi:hypothetical protein